MAKDTLREIIKAPKDCNTEVKDGRRVYPAHLEDKDIPKESYQRLFRGRWVHFLYKDESNQYHPWAIDEAGVDTITPADLYDALEDHDSPDLFCRPMHRAITPVTIALFVVVGLLILMAFMMYFSKAGNNKLATDIIESTLRFI
jgi:hypothetical protein